jgi:diacylglycerol kinase family enzyme
VVLGGDGTVNEVVQGIATTDVALAVIPGGSTNVLARSLGLPNDPIAATGVVLRRLAGRQLRRVHLGVANDRYFTFHAGFGFDAEVVRRVEQRYHLKRTVRQASFVWCALIAYVMAPGVRNATITVSAADRELLTDQRWVVSANSTPYTYLGGRPAQLCPVAGIDRELALVGLSKLSVAAILRVAWTALTSDNVGNHRFVELLADLPEIVCTADRPLPLQLDGDYIGETSRVSFETAKQALCIVG